MKQQLINLFKFLEEIFPAIALSMMFLFMIYGITKMLTVLAILFL